MQIEAKMIRPPIVGVPALAWCSWGPSSRMCCPNSLTRRYSMNFGPRKMQISIAAIPAISTSPISGVASSAPVGARGIRLRLAPTLASGGDIHQQGQGLGNRLEAGRARALDEDDVAGLELGGEQLRRLLGSADQLVWVVVAGRLADADQQIDPRLAPACVKAYLPVVARRVRPELCHLAQDRDAPTGRQRAEVVERGPHGDRVGVVAVVHEDDPVAQLEALAPEAGEAYVRSAVGHPGERRAEGDARCDGGQGVGQVVLLGEGKVERLAAGGSR